MLLWFDVGIKRYTTTATAQYSLMQLWFDVGIKRYTTGMLRPTHSQEVVV